ncbi:MAG: cellulase family glycosylhydrolase [Calditrichaeota bacterium]|nr:cellulase family glycosylhydrolase [Calditrichota bacterium]
MKNFTLFCLLLFVSNLSAAETPFKRGFNMAGWFQTSSAQQIQLTHFTKEDFRKLKEMGVDHLRLPVPLHDMTLNDENYTVDPLLFFFLDQVVDWCEDLGLYIIIDNHSFDVNVSTSYSDLKVLTRTWKQVADHFKDRSQLVCYEILNEPHGIADILWNTMQQVAIDSIRSVDTTHTIVIGPAGWNSYNNLSQMLDYNDNNLIYTFHFYEPFLYTHQGASWTDPPLTIAGVPYPYDAARMPDLPSQLVGTWYSGSYNSYSFQGTRQYLAQQLDIAAAYGNLKNVALWCGEFGAYIPNSTTEDRARWLKDMRELLEERDMAWAMWEFDGGFGVFEQGGNNMIDYDLNVPVIEALAFNAPEQSEFQQKPDSSSFIIYDDYINSGLVENSNIAGGTINYYSTENPKEGQYCLRFADAAQYGNISLQFRPIRNLEELVANNYRLDLWLNCSDPSVKLDIRFIDSKTGETGDHPWRIRYTLDNTKASFNGTWQHLLIPLKNFTEQGSWDNEQWFNPIGAYDWQQVQLFQIVAEEKSMSGMEIFFDQIRITDPLTHLDDQNTTKSYSFHLSANYPNPFNPETVIRYQIGSTSAPTVMVSLKVYDVLGREVKSVIQKEQAPGNYSVTFNATDLSSGVYYYTLTAGSFKQSHKMLLMR